MKKLIINLFSKYMSIVALITTIFAFLVHGSFTSWVANPNFLNGYISINNLLILIMFGMGLTTKLGDYVEVIKHPKVLIIGELAQFIIMPFIAFLLCYIFRLPNELAVGVILVGCCPGGTSSNVMTYMAKGDLALSIGMTSVSTLLAPFLTPMLSMLCLKLYQSMTDQAIAIDIWKMFLSIVQVVIIPVFLGILINKYFNKITSKIVQWLPVFSCIAICIIIGYVIDINSKKLLNYGSLIIFVVMIHNILGYLSGFILGKILKIETNKVKAISIEVGMQNSGLATSLATSCFPSLALATVPGAVFSAWHNISGAILANILNKKDNSSKK